MNLRLTLATITEIKGGVVLVEKAVAQEGDDAEHDRHEQDAHDLPLLWPMGGMGRRGSESSLSPFHTT